MRQSMAPWLKYMNKAVYLSDDNHKLREIFGYDVVDWDDIDEVAELKIKLLDIIPYDSEYGKFNEVFRFNIETIPNVVDIPQAIPVRDESVFIVDDLLPTDKLIPLICNKLLNGISVVYIPSTSQIPADKIIEKFKQYPPNTVDIAFVDVDKTTADFQDRFKPEINFQYPLMFNAFGDINSFSWTTQSANTQLSNERWNIYNLIANNGMTGLRPTCNRLLIDHLLMFSNLKQLSQLLSFGSYTFMSRIRIAYIFKPDKFFLTTETEGDIYQEVGSRNSPTTILALEEGMRTSSPTSITDFQELNGGRRKTKKSKRKGKKTKRKHKKKKSKKTKKHNKIKKRKNKKTLRK